MNQKHFLLSTLLFFYVTFTWAQSQLSVARFRLLENDLTAQRQGTVKNDVNGKKAALIKIVTSEQGFNFDGGSLGIVDIVYKPGEVWLYVPHHAQRLTISHGRLGVLRNYNYSVPIEGGRTYEMLLDMGTGRYVTILTEPTDATIKVDNQNHGLSPIYNIYLTYGQHTIRAQNGFLVGEEEITVSPNDSKETRILTMKMKERALENVADIKPANMNPMETITQKSYYIKNMRVIRLNMNMTFSTPAPALEKLAAFILFGDTVNTNLKKSVEAFVSQLGEVRNTSEKKTTHWYTIDMRPNSYQQGYFYSYYLRSEFKFGNDRKGRECLIIYDATTDRVLGIQDVFNPSVVDYINSKAGNTFKHMSLEDGNVVVQYQQDNDYQTLFFSLNDKTKIKPYFMALMAQKAVITRVDTITSNEFADNHFRYKIISGNEVEIIAFSGDKTIEALNIPSGVEYNGKLYTVKSIGKAAFLGCKNLKTINVDAKNSNYCVINNVLMTKNRKSLILYPACKPGDDYEIPATVKTIEAYAFDNCKLKSITIPASTTTIPASAFNDCSFLSIIHVSKKNSRYCASDNVLMTKDGKTLLRYPAGKLDDVYTVPSGVKQIEWDAFRNCKLKSVIIQNENTYIADYAFRSCRDLASVQIPSQIVAQLPETTFFDCAKLERIMLNGNIQSISAEPYKGGGHDMIYDVVDQAPSFPGGKNEMLKWFDKNLDDNFEEQINDKYNDEIYIYFTTCSFVVERDGSITKIKIVESSGKPLTDRKLVYVISRMPKWIPGKQNGALVRVRHTLTLKDLILLRVLNRFNPYSDY